MIIIPFTLILTRLVSSFFFLWRPRLDLERSLIISLFILYPTFIGAMIVSTIIAESKMIMTFASLIILMFVHTSVSNIIEFKLVQLVYILPEKYRRVLVAAEAWAGVYAALYIMLTSCLLSSSVTILWITDVIIITILDLIMAFICYRAIKNLCSSQETAKAIKLYMHESVLSNC